jgi:Tol biopolymer transport system component
LTSHPRYRRIRKLAFHSGDWDDQDMNVMVVDAEGGTPRNLTSNISDIASEPAWSPDGQHMLFVRTETREGEEEDGDIWLIHLETGALRQLTDEPYRERMPAWSADGQTIYFSGEPGGVPHIFALQPFSENPVAVQVTTSDSQAQYFPTVTPRADTIAFDTGSRNRVLFTFHTVSVANVFADDFEAQEGTPLLRRAQHEHR